jgi:hypothetical protein
MVKRRCTLGSAPYPDEQPTPSNHLKKHQWTKLNFNDETDTRELTGHQDQRIILKDWYRYGFDPMQSDEQ